MKRRFRVKTKKEFEKEFGTLWRDTVPLKFPEYMDCLCNMDITEVFTPEAINLYDQLELLTAKTVVSLYAYTGAKINISKAMIVEDTLGQKINTILKI